jgi:dipeptidyl aminopeptidase/acylaminoacyl peptidase
MATGDPVARLWSVDTGALVREFPTKGGEVVVSQFSRDGKRALIVSTRDNPRVWEVSTGKPLGELRGNTGLVDAGVFSPDGESVLASDTNGNGAIWDAHSGALLQTLLGHDGIKVVLFAVWDVAAGRLEHDFRLDNRGYIALISPDGRWASAVADWSSITVWDTSTWQPSHQYTWTAPQSGGNWAKSAAFSPDSMLLAVGDNSGELRILDVLGGKTLATIDAHKAEIRTVAFSESGRMVLTTPMEIAARESS